MMRSWRASQYLVFLLLLSVTSVRAQVNIQVGLNFTGSSYSQSQATPPDGNGVIGPTRFMEFVNGTLAVYNRTNGATVQRKSDQKFWSDAGVVIAQGWDVTDPRVIYDPATQRWFATQVDFDATLAALGGDPTTEANDFLLAVSTTSSPTGPWKGFLFQSDPDNGNFADFPTLGLDANAVYISGDFYVSNSPTGPGLLSIPKADLTNATPTIANMTWYGVMDIGVRGEVMQPAICFDGSENGSVLAMGDIGMDSNPHSNIVWSAVQNAGTTNATLSAPVSITVAPHVVPDNVDLGVPQFVALQPDRTTTLQANDARLSAKVYAVGGVLYAVMNTETNGRIAIQWYRIRASDQTLLEQGMITDSNLDLYFPSIAANQYGVLVICCNGSDTNTFISSYAYAGQTVNGHTTFGSAVLLKAGAEDYHDEGQASGTATTSRWGDYSTTSVDPNDPTQFWTIQTYPNGTATDPFFGTVFSAWSEQITQLIVTAPTPQLTLSRSGTNVVVSWPASATGYQLFSTPSLVSPVWSSVNQTVATNGLLATVTVPLSRTNTFFRLQK